jgi:5'-nucleotidase
MKRRDVIKGVPAVMAGGLAACAQPGTTQDRAPGTASLTIVHLNDVYEIVPTGNGKSGGLARVATVIRQLKAAHPAVLVTLGGDYLSPSALGTAIVDGQRLAGRQMVDVLNATGVDWATLGNHEFDVSEAQFRAHLTKAKFRLVSNVTDAADKPFPGVTTSEVVTVTVGARTIRLGLVGITIDTTRKDWVRYPDGIAVARAEVAKLRGKVDAIVGLTHLALDQDGQLAEAVPEFDLILGGHEHENWLAHRGPRFAPIVKADANVRTLAIVTLTFTSPGAPPEIASRLLVVDERIPLDPEVDKIARAWLARGFEAFRRQGFAPEEVVAVVGEPLDGRELTVRNRPGKLTDLVAAAMAREAAPVDLAIFNSGSVRIDDVIPPGEVTVYDVLRILPFGGNVVRADLDGGLLERVLITGVNNEGTGGFLQTWGVKREGGLWIVGGKPLEPARRYRVALNDFLLSGGEINLGYLTRTNPQVHNVEERRDMRHAVIAELKRS